jgi:dienelactone hydrolase
VDHWLIDSAFRTHGTNFLLPDVIDTLLEFDFNHADLKFVEREAFNVKSIPITWRRLSEKLGSLLADAELKNRSHSSFELRHRYILSLLRSWTHGQKPDEAKALWQLINDEYDKGIEYLQKFDKSVIKRVKILVAGEECHGVFRVPNHLASKSLKVLIILPGMDMTKEYVPSLASRSWENRDFATLTLDPPGHGYSFVCGTKLNSTNYDELIELAIAWILNLNSEDVNVEQIGILGIGTSATFAFRAAANCPELAVAAGFEGGFLFDPSKTLADQSSMRLKKLASMTGLAISKVAEFLDQISLESVNFNKKVPVIFTVGEYDDLFLVEQIERLSTKLNENYSINLYEGEGHVLGKVINEALVLTIDQIEECLQGNLKNLQGVNSIEKR